jgi:hypothetical protein
MKTRLLLLILSVAALALWCLAVQAQDRDQQQAPGKNTSVTGCLAKGDSPNEFYLTADNGKRYEVRSENVPLADHVGHKVTVTGTAMPEGKAMHKDEDEKHEAAENNAGDLQVTKLDMVSSSCK